MSSSSTFVLQSNDDKTFEVNEKVIAQSEVLSEMMKLIEDNESAKVIPLTISSTLLKPIVDYCNLYQDDEKYVMKDPPPQIITQKDSAFMKDISNDILEDLTNAANYLNIPRLIDACLLHLRDQMRLGKIKNKQKSIYFSYQEQHELYEKYVTWL